ncbi:receptor-like serine/threonine-protein kinase At1g78530 isoform X2 [Mercurialis annua]|uniref:receptor-like serine/threonine-protein kinase At1g78530 isoform X2 n=1 Tax=Mercurialis annua TaxID=3986 RepID=UPI0021605AC3|nr:receptor-like serine/threonine-protein kinase At1g78530 isoform X2 [Mercurialis annua]
MSKTQDTALYITLCCIAFIVSKIVIAILCYKRRKTNHFVGFSVTQSVTSEMLLKKTLKLSNKDIIGSGGYGSVYKLEMNHSLAFAVKRLNAASHGDGGFERELEALGDIKHRNVVALHGYYTAPLFNLLIYEFMPNGSLDGVLYGKSNDEKSLDWACRYKIAVGAARGISYLHHDCIPHIIHRDIKPSNILLDHNMEPRISDFGLATFIQPHNTHVSTFPAGTFGYLAPEYFDTGKATAKGDVYSFGVVLLELLTAKKPTDEAFFEEGSKLVTWVKTVVEDKSEEYALDKSIKCAPMDEVNNLFRIAMMCLEAEPTNRPTMTQIVQMLELVKPEKVVVDSLAMKRELNQTGIST